MAIGWTSKRNMGAKNIRRYWRKGKKTEVTEIQKGNGRGMTLGQTTKMDENSVKGNGRKVTEIGKNNGKKKVSYIFPSLLKGHALVVM
jgi:Zn/Cd-binding protein ZinT